MARSTPPPEDKSETSTFDIIKRIFRRKKLWEASALRAAKAREEAKLVETTNDDNETKDRELSEKKAREAASTKANEVRNELNKLFLQQAELEKSIQYQWKEKINEYEKASYAAEEEELQKLKQEQDAELKQLVDKVEAENEADKVKRAAEIAAVTAKRGEKRKADGGEDGGTSSAGESSKKRKVDDSTALKTGEEEGEVTTSNLKTGEDEAGEEEKKELPSAKKEKELENIMEEMSSLNKTKSQMVWLLKQVITAESKMKKK